VPVFVSGNQVIIYEKQHEDIKETVIKSVVTKKCLFGA